MGMNGLMFLCIPKLEHWLSKRCLPLPKINVASCASALVQMTFLDKKLRKLREAKKFTLEQLALKANVPLRAIARIECRADGIQNFPVLYQLAYVLDVTFGELIGFTDEGYGHLEVRPLMSDTISGFGRPMPPSVRATIAIEFDYRWPLSEIVQKPSALRSSGRHCLVPVPWNSL